MIVAKRMGAILILVLLTFSTPGCLEDVADNIELYQGEVSTVTMEIVHANTVADANMTYTLEIELYHDAAPNNADSFRKHVQQGNFDNVTFHRIIDDFMIQSGDFERHDGTGGYAAQWYGYCMGEPMAQASDCNSDWERPETSYTLPDEVNNNLTHMPCMLSMAKMSEPHTGRSQFFIIPEDSTPSWLDGVHTVFGKVVSGCEHVTTLSEVETDSNDRPVVPVIVVSATASE